ncbi:conserved hypothetical protein [Microsporum canis CBS 113480]|uniref:Major facilitator superfamily (MFS) profile domain-containing protein n=1 Tax=Arthroderma otae (strain ATCC MYA-4605 / CBS 113480) TaxID=554155 RepID=C5FJU9_ARTOC|nr:conserved hypothetical protein [Microsporum canis CBS 113480]EEQ30960.1 conserved hypothetical protein [Microsporum canis CBS 113480]
MASSDSNHHSSNGEIDFEKPQGPPIEPAEEESRKITGLKAIVTAFDETEDLPWLSVGYIYDRWNGYGSSPWENSTPYMILNGCILFRTVIFMAASALYGAAPTMTAEIIGRVFAGAGGNGMYFGLLALMSTDTTSKERPQYLSLTWWPGLGFGYCPWASYWGGFELYNWRWAFYINLLFGAVLLPTYFFVIPSSNPLSGVPQRQKLATFDWMGTLLSIGAFVTLVMAINFSGTLYAWDSGQAIALFTISGVLWVVFTVQQSFNILTTKESRMMPIHLCVQKEPILLFISCATVGAIAYITVYYIPIYFQFTRGDTALQSAVRLLPLIFLLITFMTLSGVFMSRVGFYKPCYVGGSILALIASTLMATIVNINTSPGVIYGLEAILGIGAGVYTQASFAVIQAVVDPADASNCLTLMLIAQLGGMTLGLSISGALFVNIAKGGLVDLFPNLPLEDIQQILSGTSSDSLKMLSPELRTEALTLIVSAWQKIFICVYASAAVSLVCSLLLSHKRVNVSTKTENN